MSDKPVTFETLADIRQAYQNQLYEAPSGLVAVRSNQTNLFHWFAYSILTMKYEKVKTTRSMGKCCWPIDGD